jgi:hypothetical protein
MSSTTTASKTEITIKGSVEIVSDFFFTAINSILYQRGESVFSPCKACSCASLSATRECIIITLKLTRWILCLFFSVRHLHARDVQARIKVWTHCSDDD